MDLTPEPGKDPKRNDLRAEVERLTSLMRTVDLFGTGFVWTDPRTGLEHMLHPADVAVVLRADTQTEFEKIKEAAYRAGREDAARERDEAIKMLADLVVKCTEYGTQDGEFVAMYLLPTGPVHRAIPWLEERGVIVRPGFDGRKAISLGRSVQGDGDSPEEQRPPSKDQGRSEPSWSRVCGPHCIDGYCCDHAEEQRP